MDKRECKRALERLFQQEQQILDDLTLTLAREQQAVVDQDTEALEQSQQRKLDQLRRIESLDEQLAGVLRGAGFGHDADGVTRCLLWCDEQDHLAAEWAALQESMAACQEHNRRNGATIELYRQHTHSALSVLRGQSVHPSTYEASGSTNSSDGSRRHIAKA